MTNSFTPLPDDFSSFIGFPKKKRKGKRKEDGSRGKEESYFHAPVAFGNRCGHDPKNPNLVSYRNPHRIDDWDKEDLDDFGSKRKSHFFYEADAALDDFYNFPRMMPELGFVRPYSDDSRQSRSDGREPVTAVLKYIVHHMCLVTKRLGYASKDGFQYYNIDHITKKTGFTASRVKRALAKLVKAGYITRERRYIKEKGGKYIAITSITTINTDLLMKRLDLTAQFATASKWANGKLQSAARAISTTVKSMVSAARLPGEYIHKKNKAKSKDYLSFPKSHINHWLLQINYKPNETKFMFNLNNIAAEGDKGMTSAEIYEQAFKMIDNA